MITFQQYSNIDAQLLGKTKKKEINTLVQPNSFPNKKYVYKMGLGFISIFVKWDFLKVIFSFSRYSNQI